MVEVTLGDTVSLPQLGRERQHALCSVPWNPGMGP